MHPGWERSTLGLWHGLINTELRSRFGAFNFNIFPRDFVRASGIQKMGLMGIGMGLGDDGYLFGIEVDRCHTETKAGVSHPVLRSDGKLVVTFFCSCLPWGEPQWGTVSSAATSRCCWLLLLLLLLLWPELYTFFTLLSFWLVSF